jgi:hypothetical protein
MISLRASRESGSGIIKLIIKDGDCTNQVESYFSPLRRVELGQHYPNVVNDRNTNRPCFESISAHVRDGCREA